MRQDNTGKMKSLYWQAVNNGGLGGPQTLASERVQCSVHRVHALSHCKNTIL